MVRSAVVVNTLALAAGHAAMNSPPSWSDPDGKFGMTDGWRNAGCVPGTGRPGVAGSGAEADEKHCAVHWYTNNTFHTGNATLPDSMRTFKLSDASFPWYAPGTAPVHSPCGVDGGNPNGCPAGNPDEFACAGGGRGNGDDGRTMPGNTKPAEWMIGEDVELAYGVEANHGGGYQYRLCPKPASNMELTEQCFTQMPLTLGDKAWIQFHGDRSNRTEFKPLRTTEGTYPAGSQWSRNAIPACGIDGGVLNFGCLFTPPQFTPPADDAYGFWGVHNQGNPSFGWGRVHSLSIVDPLTVPEVTPGDYVLQFRYDAEQHHKVWNSCADVRINSRSVSV